jgi:hypothetical protein
VLTIGQELAPLALVKKAADEGFEAAAVRGRAAEEPVAAPPAPEPGLAKPAGRAPPAGMASGSEPAAFAKGYAEAPPRRFKRRDRLSADELSKQLLAAPEVDLIADGPQAVQQVVAATRADRGPYTHAILDPLMRRSDLHGLPVVMGYDCQLGKESAHNLQALSRKLRAHLAQARPQDGDDPRLNVEVLRQQLRDGHEDWEQEDALPTLVQMLQPEDRPVRLLLVELLGRIKGRAATAALAQRALFDLSAEVREAAVWALKERPRDEYRALLLEGLRYPWAPAADHAAEALAALEDQEAVPQLVALLREPDPAGPVARETRALDLDGLRHPQATRRDAPWERSLVSLEDRQGGAKRTAILDEPDRHWGWARAARDKVYAVRVLVRVNHLRNCVLCHAPAQQASDPVRGLVPTPGQPLNPPASGYSGGSDGTFVRADVTYLRQDFSVPQPVARPGNWPVHQRYDYLVRTRYPTPDELLEALKKRSGSYPQLDAVLFALRELTGRDGGSSAEGWQEALAQGGKHPWP